MNEKDRSSPASAQSYKDTLNLPSTRFEMKANLTEKEPARQALWNEQQLYALIRQARAGAEKRVLHDGPPYANGEIHMGHLLNKVLKDVVVRSLTMLGYDSPYVPGWDCHGLPIEHKVVKDLGSKARDKTQAEIRALCRDEALKWVGIQSDQFRRLGIEGDWKNPYLTLDPRYEAGVLDVLADLVERGGVFRQKKPIHWCMNDRTALAEAELEYKEETTPSVYVNFPISRGIPESWGPEPWSAMIWTTTPWTLPANVAIALHPELEYAGVRYVDPTTKQETHAVVATKLVEKVMTLGGVESFSVLGKARGKELEGATYKHVFIDREAPLVLADYVSVEDGTGLVHTAPGHGGEDYQTGKAYGLETLSPVDASGRFDASAPDWLVGKPVFAANAEIVSRLRETGVLFHSYSFVHSYPHCWRCKKPVIFRATEQWFIGVDKNDLRSRALAAIEEVEWLPDWGKTRIESMVSNRPDWCISRQRSWGVPIPAFRCVGCEEMLLTAESIRRIRDLFRQGGADLWYSKTAAELLPLGAKCEQCGAGEFEKASDILDVWFESGSSHRAVLAEPSFHLQEPAFLYLEGSDQHRGWFQSSLLTSVGTRGRAPFQKVLTHGFIVDEQGRKQSKSEGNAISAVESTKKYGADVLRLYVASLDYSDDVRMSERGVKEMSEVYRKIRNTLRFILGNLEDYNGFDPLNVPIESLHEIDLWALGRLNDLIRDVKKHYAEFDFYRVYQKIHQFCVVDLSSIYLDVLKDRLYAEAREGVDRNAARYVMARLHDALARLLAPIVPHTAEELWDFIPSSNEKTLSVHLALFPTVDPHWDDPLRDERWKLLLAVRTDVLRELERLRASKRIGSGQEANVILGSANEKLAALLASEARTLQSICIVSTLSVGSQRPDDAAEGVDVPELWLSADRSPHPKCERCWNLREDVGSDPAHPTLCRRCADVLAARKT